MLVVRTSWNRETDCSVADLERENLWIMQEPIHARTAREMICEFEANGVQQCWGELRFVCKTDEELGILHGTLAALDIPLERVAPPDPPNGENWPLTEAFDVALVVEQPEVEWGQPIRRSYRLYRLAPDDIPF